MIIESENMKESVGDALILTPQELSEKLQKSLNIDLVLIALTNCNPFCEIFLNQGVQHVVSFTFIKFKTEG